jgi:L-amino acid N-acyltransferase
VAELDGAVVGWAPVSAWSERRAHDDTGEVSVYVAERSRGGGIGRRLLEVLLLLTRATSWGYHTRLDRIAEGKTASLRLHLAQGFACVGVMREVGAKFGRRLDVHLLPWMVPAVAAAEPKGATPA